MWTVEVGEGCVCTCIAGPPGPGDQHNRFMIEEQEGHKEKLSVTKLKKKLSKCFCVSFLLFLYFFALADELNGKEG
jgi:hypothetical protein